jgi:transcriptional regulator with XRE-family HTH domain
MNKLKEILEEKNINQSDVAKKLGITRQVISVWATNISDPNVENIRKICKLLNVTSDELLGINNKE